MNIEAKSQRRLIIVFIIGVVVFVFGAIYFTLNSLHSEYTDYLGLFLGLFFGALSIGCFNAIFQIKKYEFDGEKNIIKSIFNTTKKVIYVRDIKSYNEIAKSVSYYILATSSWYDLTIFTDRDKEIFSSSLIANYEELKSVLTKGVVRDTYSEKLFEHKINRRFGVMSLILGLLLLALLMQFYKGDVEIKPEQLTTITVRLTQDPEIRNLESTSWITLKAVEYPKFRFNMHGAGFKAANSTGIMHNLKRNDQVQIDVLSETKNRKGELTQTLSYMEPTHVSKSIDIYGLRKDSKVYINLDRVNEEIKRESSGIGFWFFLWFVLGLIIVGLYILTIKKPIANNINYK